MPEAAIALNLLQAIDVLMHLAAQRAFDGVFAVEDGRNARDVFVGQFRARRNGSTRAFSQTMSASVGPMP